MAVLLVIRRPLHLRRRSTLSTGGRRERFLRRGRSARRRSAVAWPEAISAPLLIIYGGADGAVSPLQSLDLATRLQMLGRPYGLIVFEGDGHTLNASRVERDRQAAEWFRKRL